jgi:hypothetical protein
MALFRVFELHSFSILGRRYGPGFRELDLVRAVEMVFGDAEGSFGSFSQHAPGFPARRLEKDIEARSSQDADKKLLLGGLNVLGVDCGHARVRISGSSSTVRTLPEDNFSRNAGFFMHVNRSTSKCSGKF